MSKPLNRRAVLSATAGALAAATTAIPVAAFASGRRHPDATLLDLCQRWHAAHAEYVSVVCKASDEVDALPTPKCPPELFLTLTGEPRPREAGRWDAVQLDGIVRHGKYPDSSFKDYRTGGVMTWFEQEVSSEELDVAIRLLGRDRTYERQMKEYRTAATAIESQSLEAMRKLDALFREMSDTVATTPEGINAKCAIVVQEATDFSDDFIQEAALNILCRDLPAMLAKLNGGPVS